MRTHNLCEKLGFFVQRKHMKSVNVGVTYLMYNNSFRMLPLVSALTLIDNEGIFSWYAAKIPDWKKNKETDKFRHLSFSR